jgi:hypothetical protein
MLCSRSFRLLIFLSLSNGGICVILSGVGVTTSGVVGCGNVGNQVARMRKLTMGVVKRGMGLVSA